LKIDKINPVITKQKIKGKFYTFRLIVQNKFALTGLLVLLFLSLLAVFAEYVSPFNPDMQVLEFTAKGLNFKSKVLVKKSNSLIPIKDVISDSGDSIIYKDYDGKEKLISKDGLLKPSHIKWEKNVTYLLGTDGLGRDILSRIIYGTRISLSVGLISQSIALLIGIFFGATAGYFKGITDKAVMWLINVVWAFPSILFVIAISVVLGKGYWQAFVAIGFTGWVDIARIIRGQFFELREKEFVEAAKASGFKSPRIIFRHILPNCIGPLVVSATVGLATAIIFEASLSFLGLGVQPPTASWGQMIYDGYIYIIVGTNWWIAILPSIAILVTVLSVNLLGDGLRDSLDQKLIK